MSEKRDRVHELMSVLKQQRDGIKVNIHLGEMDVKDEWDQLEMYEERMPELNSK